MKISKAMVATILVAFLNMVISIPACDTISNFASGKLVTIVLDGKPIKVTKVNGGTTLS